LDRDVARERYEALQRDIAVDTAGLTGVGDRVEEVAS
jgi:hypothetical protein